MRTELIIVALAVGLGTWLFRYLPTRFGGVAPSDGGRLARSVESLGPAAIATLFVASILPAVTPGGSEVILALVGCAATLQVFRLRRNVVLATMAGAAAYGVAFALLA